MRTLSPSTQASRKERPPGDGASWLRRSPAHRARPHAPGCSGRCPPAARPVRQPRVQAGAQARQGHEAVGAGPSEGVVDRTLHGPLVEVVAVAVAGLGWCATQRWPGTPRPSGPRSRHAPPWRKARRAERPAGRRPRRGCWHRGIPGPGGRRRGRRPNRGAQRLRFPSGRRSAWSCRATTATRPTPARRSEAPAPAQARPGRRRFSAPCGSGSRSSTSDMGFGSLALGISSALSRRTLCSGVPRMPVLTTNRSPDCGCSARWASVKPDHAVVTYSVVRSGPPNAHAVTLAPAPRPPALPCLRGRSA